METCLRKIISWDREILTRVLRLLLGFAKTEALNHQREHTEKAKKRAVAKAKAKVTKVEKEHEENERQIQKAEKQMQKALMATRSAMTAEADEANMKACKDMLQPAGARLLLGIFLGFVERMLVRLIADWNRNVDDYFELLDKM